MSHKSLSRLFPLFAALLFLGLSGVANAQKTPLPELDAAPPPARPAAEPEARQTFAAADDALAAGLASLASEFYTTLAKDFADSPALRDRALIGLATCHLERNNPAAAVKILEALPPTPVRTLRLAIARLLLGQTSAANALLKELEPSRLDPEDLPWHHVAIGLASFATGDAGIKAAREEFERAAALCTASGRENQARHVRMLGWLANVKAVPLPTTAGIDATRDLLARTANTPLAFQYAKILAIDLARLGRTAEAVNTLSQAPVASAAERAEVALLTGFILGADKPDGRTALYAVLASGQEFLRDIALDALVSTAQSANTPAASALAVEIHDKLAVIPGTFDALLLARAKIMLAAEDFPRAERAANDLLARTPPEPYFSDALRVLATGAWQSGSLRRAADYLAQLKNRAQPGPERARLALATADSLFLAAQNLAKMDDATAINTYTAAAAAYADALQDIPTPEQRGDAFFLRIRCLILAGNATGPEGARDLLDKVSPGFADAHSLLRCEWALIEWLRNRANRTERRAASARLAAVFTRHADMPPEFRVRFLWQQAELANAGGERTLATAKATEIENVVMALPETAPLAAKRAGILSRVLLLRARMAIAASEPESAQKLFLELRTKYPESEAAAASYIVEGRALSSIGAHERARLVFRAGRAASNSAFARNANPVLAKYAAEALFEAATERMRLGQIPEAIEALENFAAEYPQDKLANIARFRQGNLFRRLNRFDDARAVYTRLRDKLPEGPERLSAEMGLADCLFARATSGDTSAAAVNTAFEQAARAYEGLFARPGATAGLTDLRAEAGYKWADTLSRRQADTQPGGRTREDILREACQTYWIVTRQILKPPGQTRPPRLGPSANYWMARAYDRLAFLWAERGRPDEAAQVCRDALAYCDAGLLTHRAVFQAALAKYSAVPAPPAPAAAPAVVAPAPAPAAPQ